MSCSNNAAPINVTSTNNKCDVTCNFSFDYGISTLNVTNTGDHLLLSYDGKTDVTYNHEKYTVRESRIYKPSLNKYNGTYVDAELFIHHISMTGKNLLVCVPIINSNSSSASNQMFSEIIPYIPSQLNEQITINTNQYTLNKFIPRGGYFVHDSPLPYPPCNGNYTIIMFDPSIAINMNNENMNTLASVLSETEKHVRIINDNDLYYNEKGTRNPSSSTDTDEIYIQCNALDENGNIIEEEPSISRERNAKPYLSMSDDIKKYLEISGGVAGGIVTVIIIVFIWRKIKQKLSSE